MNWILKRQSHKIQVRKIREIEIEIWCIILVKSQHSFRCFWLCKRKLYTSLTNHHGSKEAPSYSSSGQISDTSWHKPAFEGGRLERWMSINNRISLVLIFEFLEVRQSNCSILQLRCQHRLTQLVPESKTKKMCNEWDIFSVSQHLPSCSKNGLLLSKKHDACHFQLRLSFRKRKISFS